MRENKPHQFSLFDDEPTFTAMLSGKAIRSAREARGLSIRALAKVAGVDAMTLLRIETGEQSGNTSTLSRISLAVVRPEETIALARESIEPGTKAHLRDIEPWASDDVARSAVVMHPDGLTGDQVAELLSLSATAVDTAQREALEKLRVAASQSTVHGAEVRRWVASVLEIKAAKAARTGATDWMSEGES